MSKLGIEEEYPWPDFCDGRWPGRELKWMWCHPALTVVLFTSFIGFIVLAVTS